jgi:SAM-dependent methyltransferase
MNRNQRRADEKRSDDAHMQAIAENYDRARVAQEAGDLAAAAQLYRKVIALWPTHAAARDRLGFVYLQQGKADKAAEQYAELVRAVPQVLMQFDRVLGTIALLAPELANALGKPVPDDVLASSAFRAIAANQYLRAVLESTPVVDLALERWLTGVRAAMLKAALAGAKADDVTLALAASLAQQCFINEYVFSLGETEAGEAERLAAEIDAALAKDANVASFTLATLGMYRGLHTLPHGDALAARRIAPPVAAVVTQQVIEPMRERELRATIPQLTPISDGVTAAVRAQYEESPYPRWVRLGVPPLPLRVLDDYIRQILPAASFRPTGAREALDVLVAGCGTGRHALDVAQGYQGARVLAVDISLSSLAAAKRHTPPHLAGRIEFAQADILALGGLERRFDLINSTGVLHHMERALDGWRELIKLLKPDGLMQVGLYSTYARRDVVAARGMIAARGLAPTPEGIRALREDLIREGRPHDFMRLNDFFTVSECRDLLFHVHERRFTIPEIKAFLDGNGLNFDGYEFAPQAHRHHHDVFARNGWAANDLDRWDAYERAEPQTFAGMYIFWVQKK